MAVERLVNLSDELGDSVKLLYHAETNSCEVYVPGQHLVATVVARPDHTLHVMTWGDWYVAMPALVAAEKFMVEMLEPIPERVLRKPRL